jgi:hypothetical protein
MIRLTSSDEAMLKAALNGGFHLATQWYFDWDPLDYQYVFHYIPIKNVTAVMGIGAGKTSGVSASYLMNCMTYPGFKALNASVTAKQAELAFEMVDAWLEAYPRLNRFVVDKTLRPYPILRFANTSTFEFRTAGQGAKFIRGHEYDRINYDEAGLDEDGEAIKVFRGRLRGTRIDGSPRMARLDVTGTPTPAVWFRERFEQGLPGHPSATPKTLKNFLSMRVTTWDNKRLTKEQIELMEAAFPAEYADIEMRALFPDWGLSTFPLNHIKSCTDAELNDDMEEALRPETGSARPGYILDEWPRVGTVHYEVPPNENHLHIMAGDPGVDSPPRRNSPCIMVFDISVKPATLVYFNWVSGRGSYKPFLAAYQYAAELYRPISKGVDTTGTQMALDELGFENYGLIVDALSFGHLKDVLVNSLSMALANQELRFPRIEGLTRQLATYDRYDDKNAKQDLVMTIAMVAYLLRYSKGQEHAVSGRRPTPNYRNRLRRTSRHYALR